jgi:hypothetical protein
MGWSYTPRKAIIRVNQAGKEHAEYTSFPANASPTLGLLTGQYNRVIIYLIWLYS